MTAAAATLRRETAFHEAGHAAMHASRGRGADVELYGPADERGSGGCTPVMDDLLLGWEAALSSSAGFTAEAILRGLSIDAFLVVLRRWMDEVRAADEAGRREMAGSDQSDLVFLADRKGIDVEEAVRSVWSVLAARWPEVEAVATALLAKPLAPDGSARLSVDEVRAAMRSAAPVQSPRRAG